MEGNVVAAKIAMAAEFVSTAGCDTIANNVEDLEFASMGVERVTVNHAKEAVYVSTESKSGSARIAY